MIDYLLDPDTSYIPTEGELADLTPAQREVRLQRLIDQARHIVADAIATHLDGHELVGRVVLFSGGNDSTVLAHLMHQTGLATHFAHANTTIGIEDTRQFVRDVSEKWGVPLLEKYPDTTYAELVTSHGFPGPGHHYKMYQQLKERCLRKVRRELVINGRQQRVLFIAGRRRSESARRSGFRNNGQPQVPLHERENSVIWASPIAMWTKSDLVFYRAMFDVPFNPVTDALGMSGECLCGAFAVEGELEHIRTYFPETAAEIDDLQTEVAAAGWNDPHCRWGHMSKGKSVRYGKLCGSCEQRAEALA